ncbi:hypothetical protein AMTR_s00029p00021500 [Amborella trichopoda]|uniref:Uncharacterized protein n=1 Tax=Amborella trichopoda TaxID=13333 RepID=W1PMU3_AMBTC|nr:hypothetical protein AMTR_s00029p00021500 [Amborella trichopoda]
MTIDTVESAASDKKNSSVWTREQEKAFENALAIHSEESADRWEKIAAEVNGKTVADIKRHYELLVEDVNCIESGRVPLPSYSSLDGSTDLAGETGVGKKGAQYASHLQSSDSSPSAKGSSRSDQERRKGIAWTEEEHRYGFLTMVGTSNFSFWSSIEGV